MSITVTRFQARSLIAIDVGIFVPSVYDALLADDRAVLGQLVDANYLRDTTTRTPGTWSMDRLERHTIAQRAIE